MLLPHGDKSVKDVAVGPTPSELVLIRVWRRVILPLPFLVPFSHGLFSNQGSAVVKRCSRSTIELSSCLFSPSQTQGSVPAKKKKGQKKKAPFPPLALSFLHGKDRKLNSVVHRGCLSLCDPCWQHVVLWWKLFLNPCLFLHIAFFFHANDYNSVQCLLSRACLCWPDVTFQHSLDVELSVSALMAAAAEQADLGESSNSSRSGVAVTLPDSLSSMFSAGPGHQVRRSTRRSILGGAHPHPHPHPPTHPFIKHTQISYVGNL